MEQESRNSMGLIVTTAIFIVMITVGGLAYMVNENSRSQRNNELAFKNELREIKNDISNLKSTMETKDQTITLSSSTQAEQTKEEPSIVTENTDAAIPPSPPTPVASTLVDCKTNYECFAQRAKTCEKTKIVYTFTTEVEETPGLVTNLSIPYEITGPSNGKCEFFHGTLLMKVTATEAAKQLIMKSEGITKEMVEKEIADTNKTLADSAIEHKQYCVATTGAEIATHLQKWATGEQKISGIYGETTYGPNITCRER